MTPTCLHCHQPITNRLLKVSYCNGTCQGQARDAAAKRRAALNDLEQVFAVQRRRVWIALGKRMKRYRESELSDTLAVTVRGRV